MTVASLVHRNIVRSRSSAYKPEVFVSRKSKHAFAIILILGILAIGFLYVFQSNTITAKGYVIEGLQKELKDIETANKLLQIEVSNLESVSNLEAKTGSMEMIKAQHVDYVSLPKASALLVK
jgi:hypothetical protein